MIVASMALALGLAPGGAAAAAAGEPVASVTELSNGRTASRWAYPESEAVIREHPQGGSPALGRLRFLTGDGQAELYIALASARLADGRSWTRIEVPGRPNGRSGWVPSGALGPLHTAREHLVVDRRLLRATLYRASSVLFSAPVGVGKPGTVTPAGTFYVMEKLVTIDAPAYGPYAIGTSAFAPTLSEWPGGGVVGIHGTDQPQLIPGRPSHGCVRMRDADIARLWHLIEVGAPIDIV